MLRLIATCLLAGLLPSFAATVVWNGDNPELEPTWTTDLNWYGGKAPSPGDSLVFGTGLNANDNDFPADTAFASITFTNDNWDLAGNTINLTGPGVAVFWNPIVMPSSANVLELPIVFTSAALISNAAPVSALVFTGLMDNGGNLLTVGEVAGGSVILRGPVTGGGGLTQTGAGILTLQNPANNYSGNTTVAQGTLRLAANSVLPAGPGAGDLVVEGTLDFGGTTQIINGLSGTGLIINSSAAMADLSVCGRDVNSTFTFNGLIQGALNLSKLFARPALVLTRPNTYTGSTTIRNGTLLLGTNNALPPTTSLTIGVSTNDAFFDLAGYNQQLAGLVKSNTGLSVITNSSALSDSTLTFSNPSTPSVFMGRIVDRPLRKVGVTVAGGSLTLRQPNSNYRGLTLVTNSGSQLTIWTGPSGGGPFSVGDGATLGITVAAAGDTLNMSSLNLGSTASDRPTLTIDLGAFGNPTNAPITTTSLAVNGTTTINIASSRVQLGQFPLIKHSGAIGGGGFTSLVLGSLPPGVTARLLNNVANMSVDLDITAYAGSLVWTGEANGTVATAWDIGKTTNWTDVASGLAATYTETGSSGPLVLFDDSASNGVVNLTIPVKPFAVTINNSNLNYAFSGAGSIGGAASLVKQGPGSLTLSISNNYSGDTTISGGTVKLGAAGAIPGGSGHGNLGLDGTLDLAGVTNEINGLTGAGTIDNSAGQGTLLAGGNNQTSAFNGIIQNSGGTLSVTKVGSGTLTLAGANTYSGTTTVQAGTLGLITAAQSTGPLIVRNATTLAITATSPGHTLTTSSLVLGSVASDVTTNSFSLGIFGNPRAPVILATNLTVSGMNWINIAGSGFSVGQFPLLAYQGTPGGSGSFQLGSLPLGLGAYLSNTPGALELVITNPATYVWTGNQNSNWDIGASLNWQLNGVPITYADGDTVLFDSRGSARNQVNLVSTVAPGSITANTAASDYTLGGPGGITGAGGLTKIGIGTLTLNTSNSFSGATSISAGVLKLGNSGALNGSASIVLASNAVLDASALSGGLVVGSGNSLGGYGTVLGAAALAEGSSLAPGMASGTLTINGNLTLGGNATLYVSKAGTLISGNQVAVGKQLTFGGASSLTVVYGGDTLMGGEVFHLFQAASYDGALYSWSLPPLGSGLNWALNRLTVDGTISVNRPATAGSLAVQTMTDLPVYLDVANLLALFSEPEGEQLTLLAIGTAGHGTVVLDSDCTTLIYTPDPGYAGPDQFTYTVSDEHGGLTIATNVIQVVNAASPGYNRFQLSVPSGGKPQLRFTGFPGDSYTIQRSTNLVDWIDILIELIPSNGILTFQDTTLPTPPPPRAYYRAVFDLATSESQAAQIIQATGVKGGFITHVGCGDGQLTAALQRNLSYRVQGLDRNPTNVAAARQYISSLGIYGYVSADQWDGAHLPYIDNFVNLAVVQDMGTMTTNEILRVLAPLGVAYVQQSGSWMMLVKPRPTNIDEWTHYEYDATGICVAQDTVVGPPKRYQWLAGPRFNRHHDVMSSFNAGVSANGRLFYVEDDGSRQSILLPPKWAVFARDAFNGTLLWKRPISAWHPWMYSLKSGPAQLPHRLVAISNVVYATLDYYGPVVALDAATGATLQTYNQTAAAQEIYWSQGTLFVLVDPNPKQWPIWDYYYNTSYGLKGYPSAWWEDHPRVITALDAATGRLLWTNTSLVYPTSIAADSTGVVFHNGTNIVKLDRNDGHQLWVSSKNIPVLNPSYTANGLSMILYQDTVLMAGGPGPVGTLQGQNIRGYIWSVDSTTGQVLASWQHSPNSHLRCPNDLFVLDDLVWSTAGASTNPICTGYDRRTGAAVRTNDPGLNIDWIHERCYRSKATVNYFLTSRACLEVISTQTNWGLANDWVRAACLYGFIPCNGMIYTTPNDCSCQFLAKLTGLGALAPASADPNYPPVDPDSVRLQPGPAYGQAVPSTPSPDDWPIHRHDIVRSGYTTSAVPANLNLGWQASFGGKLSSVTVAEGAVFVAKVDQHTMYALDALTGSNRWSYTVGGRVDSPPTIYQGRVLFGAADGYVYCLRASDGALIWRFLAAPTDLHHMSYDQVESVWPVSGSVLVVNDRVYAVAGCSMYLDGGCRFVILNPTNGVKIIEQVMNDKIPGTTNSLTTLEKTFNAPVALPDLLSSDGQRIFMKSQWFDLDGVRTNIAPVSADVRVNAAWGNQIGEGVHLFTPTGFLDDSWMHRTYWVWGKSWSSGAGGYYLAGLNAPCGQILCIDDSNVYGYGRMLQYYRWTLPKENMLFSTSSQNNFYQSNPYNWTNTLPFFVKAMVVTSDMLFLAGPPDVEDEQQSFSTLNDPQTESDLASQDAALRGAQGGQLRVVDKATGNTLAMSSVNFVPVWDGMAASRQSLFLATRDGRVVCLR